MGQFYKKLPEEANRNRVIELPSRIMVEKQNFWRSLRHTRIGEFKVSFPGRIVL